MPDPLPPSSGSGLMGMPMIANGEDSAVSLDPCQGYYSISKKQVICPAGQFPCGEKFFEDRKKLNSGFLRSFLVQEGVASSLFWLYRRVRKAIL